MKRLYLRLLAGPETAKVKRGIRFQLHSHEPVGQEGWWPPPGQGNRFSGLLRSAYMHELVFVEAPYRVTLCPNVHSLRRLTDWPFGELDAPVEGFVQNPSNSPISAE